MKPRRLALASAAAVLGVAVWASTGAEGARLLSTKRSPPPGAAAPAAANAPDAMAVDDAIRQLNSPDWILQAEAIALLARAKAPQAVAPLKGVLAGQWSPWVRGRALVALAEIGNADACKEAVASASDALPQLREAAMEALGICGSAPALPAVEAHLADPVPGVRNQALVALARLQKDKAWDRIAPLVSDADPATVAHAARALVYVGTTEARQAIIGLLGHKDVSVRLAAIRAERELRDPEAAALLIRHMVGDATTEVQWAAERALLAYDPEVLAKPCLAALEDKESLHGAALRILVARPSEEARAGLAKLLAEPGNRLRAVTANALDALAGDDPSPYQDVIVKHLDNQDPHVRRKAVDLVALCPQADRWGLLKPRLTDTVGYVAVAALKALRGEAQGAPPGGIVDYLADALKGLSAETAEECLGLLGERLTAEEMPKAVAALDPLLASADENRRRQALAALGRLAEGDAARRIAAAQGYLVQWSVLGPFPSDVEGRGFTAAYPPEFGVDTTKGCEGFPFGCGAAFEVVTAAAGNVRRQALSIRPPEENDLAGRTVASYTLDLPQGTDIKLDMFTGIQQDAPQGDGVRFVAVVSGAKVLDRKVTAAEGWVPAVVDLSSHAGKRIVLDLSVDALGKAAGDWALVGEPRITAGGAVAADLVKLAPLATARIAMPGAPAERLSWEPVRSIRPTGEVDVRQLIPGPEMAVAYAAADLRWPRDEDVCLFLDADGPVKLWVNGEKSAERAERGSGPMQVSVSLKQGVNRLLLKVCNDADRWTFSVRLTDLQGRRLDPAKPQP